MSLKTTYKEYILEQLLMEYLKDGTVPTADTLESDLVTYQETHPDLSLPKSKFIDFSVDKGSESSAAQIKEIAETVSNDAGVIVREIYKIANTAIKFYERWSFESKRLAAKAQKLEQRIDSILLLTNNTAGYFATVGDVFTDMNLTDTDNTTAFVNVDEQAISLNPGTTNAGTVKQVNMTELTERDVAFYPLTKNPGTSVRDVNKGNGLLEAFKTQDTKWVGVVTSSKSGVMTCELKANISKDVDVEVSRIAIDYNGSTSADNTITAMHSLDGYNWYIVPTTDATKTLSSNMSWSFPMTNMRWIKFIFYKAAPDSGSYEYNFSIGHIRAYGVSYTQGRGNVFVSKSLSATDTDGNIIGFNLSQLDVCENVPSDTDIKYYMAASKDNSTWTGWVNTMPSQREGIQYPKVLNFSGAGLKTSSDLDAVKFNSLLDIDTIITTFDSSITVDGSSRSIFQYRFKDAAKTTFGAVNTAIPASTDEDQDTVSNSVGLWRNIRCKTTYSDTALVRGVARGWGNNEKKYSCFFEILNSNGKLLDFGDQECVLDNQVITGVVKVSAGIHKFETLADYWFDIGDNYTALGVVNILTEETLKNIDPLYPHNHKLIIEGFPYHADFKGDKVYSGTDYSGEFYATQTSLFNLENNINDYGYFAIRGVGKNEEAATLSVIVRYDSSDSDYTNELFYTTWRTGQSGNEMYRYIKLKAEFLTDSTALTPMLTSYRIKLGL